MHEALLLAAALIISVAGMGWLALSLDAHWRQVFGSVPRAHATVRRLRIQGAAGLATSLVLCLVVDTASIATLVWIMLLATAALIVAFTLAGQAGRLRMLAPGHPRAGKPR